MLEMSSAGYNGKIIRIYMVLLGGPSNSAENINEKREKKKAQYRSLEHTQVRNPTMQQRPMKRN
jgi:hypothetical protein